MAELGVAIGLPCLRGPSRDQPWVPAAISPTDASTDADSPGDVETVELESSLVDPRDVTEEDALPAYRVYFWSRDGSRCEEHRIEPGAEVCDVLTWAESQRRDRVPVVYAETGAGQETGRRLLRLQGSRPESR
jgi:hypothetical protein